MTDDTDYELFPETIPSSPRRLRCPLGHWWVVISYHAEIVFINSSALQISKNADMNPSIIVAGSVIQNGVVIAQATEPTLPKTTVTLLDGATYFQPPNQFVFCFPFLVPEGWYLNSTGSDVDALIVDCATLKLALRITH